MTERGKMLAGMVYDANYDEELCKERLQCKDLCHQFNQLLPSDEEGQQQILHQLLGSMGQRCAVVAPFYCDYGWNIYMGNDVFFNHGCVILDGGKVTFGDHVFVAPGCSFHTAGHPLDVEQRNAGLEYAYPITVEDDVWIGANVTVLPGVTIGRGSVIGAGSVVNRDIPAGVVAVGNPCRVLRTITEQDKMEYQK